MVTSTVWPSGAAVVTVRAPMLPAAPPRFSITTGWPSRLANGGPTRRAIESAAPPGANATTRLMRWDG